MDLTTPVVEPLIICSSFQVQVQPANSHAQHSQLYRDINIYNYRKKIHWTFIRYSMLCIPIQYKFSCTFCTLRKPWCLISEVRLQGNQTHYTSSTRETAYLDFHIPNNSVNILYPQASLAHIPPSQHSQWLHSHQAQACYTDIHTQPIHLFADTTL